MVLSALAGACTAPSGAATLTPLSRECEACLMGSTDAAPSCADPYRACSADPTCNDAMVCELRNGCYESAPGGSCASDGGCLIRADAGAAESERSAFESCARTTCADACVFVAP